MEREDPHTCVFSPKKGVLTVRRVVGESVAGLFVQQAANEQALPPLRSLRIPRCQARSRDHRCNDQVRHLQILCLTKSTILDGFCQSDHTLRLVSRVQPINSARGSSDMIPTDRRPSCLTSGTSHSRARDFCPKIPRDTTRNGYTSLSRIHSSRRI